jgi:hypothetical protein
LDREEFTMHIIIGLFILGAVIWLATTVFSVLFMVFAACIGFAFSGIGWAWNKLRGL